MRDNHHIMTHFVKIVERYPAIYDRNMEAHRTRQTELAWEEIADCVRSEIKEECTVDELKLKWKGLRSSFSRYKNKLYHSSYDPKSCKKYYLYDALKFLEPFTINKSILKQGKDATIEDDSIFVEMDETEASSDYNAYEEWNNTDVKPDIWNKIDKDLDIDRLDKVTNSNDDSKKLSIEEDCDKVRKRIKLYTDNDYDNENGDMHFFRSILPDIRNLTNREKRKFKIGVLKLIDDLENEKQKAD